MSTDRIDFVYKHNTGRISLGLVEQITNTAGTNTNEHLDKLGTGNRKEWNAGLPLKRR